MKHKPLFILLSIIIAMSMILAACGTPATEEPAAQAPTEAPMEEPTEAPMEEPTEAPMESPLKLHFQNQISLVLHAIRFF